MTTHTRKSFELTGWHVLAAMVVFFGCIAAVNAVMVTLAVQSFPGEEQKKSYMQGLQYNEVIEARAEQAARGWRVLLENGTELPASASSISLTLMEPGDQPLRGFAVEAVIGWPVTDDYDQVLIFEEVGDGIYTASIDVFAQGGWELKGTATSPAGETIEFEKRLWVR